MGSLWDFFKNILGIEDFTSPREAFLNWVIKQLMDPSSIDISTAEYAKVLGIMATLVSFVIVPRLVYVLWQCMVGQSLQALKEWLYAAFFTFVFLLPAPAFVMGAQYFFNILGASVFRIFLGDDMEASFKALKQLSGNSAFDFTLSSIQIVALAVLTLSIQLVPIALGASVILFLWGINLNWLGKMGEQLYDFAIRVTVYGATGNLIALASMGVIAGLGGIFTDPRTVERALVNTLAIMVAAILLWRMLRSVGGSMKATISAAAATGRAVRGYMGGSENNVERGGGKSQRQEEANARKAHSKHKTFSRKTSRRTTAETSEPTNDQQPDRGRSSKATPPRFANTRQRISRRPAGQAQQGTNQRKGGARPETTGTNSSQQSVQQGSYRRSRPSQTSGSAAQPSRRQSHPGRQESRPTSPPRTPPPERRN